MTILSLQAISGNEGHNSLQALSLKLHLKLHLAPPAVKCHMVCHAAVDIVSCWRMHAGSDDEDCNSQVAVSPDTHLTVLA